MTSKDLLLSRAIAATIKAQEAEEQSKRYEREAAAAENERWKAVQEFAEERKLDTHYRGPVILFKYDGIIYECYFNPHLPRSSWILREANMMY